MSMLASSVFLASAADTLSVQSHILRNTQAAVEDTSTSLKHWFSVSGMSDEARSSPQFHQFISVSHLLSKLSGL